MTASHQLTEAAGGIRFANGVALSPDGTLLYVVESPTGRVWRFGVNPDGSLGPRQMFIDLRTVFADDAGHVYTPDSMRTDRHGNVFIALYDGGGVAVFRPDGRLLTKISLPHAHHTNLAITPDGGSIDVTSVDDAPDGGYRGAIDQVANPAQ